MSTLSLKELKELNAQESASDVPNEDAPTLEESATLAEPPEQETVEEPKTEPKEEAIQEGEAEDESWMQTEETETSDGGFVPNHGAAAVRKKLKAQINAKDDELAKIRAELEALKSKPSKAESEPRPSWDDFDSTEEYDKAVDEWNDRRLDQKLSGQFQKTQQETQQAQTQNAIQRSVDTHYDKAAQLVQSGKISEEQYRNADSTVRTALDRIFQGQGDPITDSLIHTLNMAGEGSEKVIYQLGVNPSKLAKLESLLRDDPNGLAATAYLGTLQASITAPVKRRSAAPPPAAKVEGEGIKGQDADLYRKYKKFGVGTNDSFQVKRQAKAAGIDTSQW